ncbi:MAG: sigma-70 family RNA polymerase sigma factor [Bacilli bacterium]|nr:sigma-70 family RNA polymerase sigma factor [Bacilli bacterium]
MNLLNKLRAKDEEAYKYLVDKYKDTFYCMSRNYLYNDEDIKDCVQEIFMKIYDRVDQYSSDKGDLSSWIIILAKNHIVDYYRKISKFRSIVSYDDNIVMNQREIPQDNKALSLIDELKEYLGEADFEVLVYRIETKLSYTDMGKVLGISRPKAKEKYNEVYQKAQVFINEKEMK